MVNRNEKFLLLKIILFSFVDSVDSTLSITKNGAKYPCFFIWFVCCCCFFFELVTYKILVLTPTSYFVLAIINYLMQIDILSCFIFLKYLPLNQRANIKYFILSNRVMDSIVFIFLNLTIFSCTYKIDLRNKMKR